MVVRLLFVANAVLAAPGFAAQYFVQPSATLGAENDSNLDLDPGQGANVQGYLANAAALIGINTPTSDSTIRARVDYRDYPKDRGNDRLEEFLDFRSEYKGELSHASIGGTISHQDDFNAEFSSALFDQINPVQPTSTSTGKTTVGETITSVLLLPSYSYNFSPIIEAGVSGIYQSANYTPSLTDSPTTGNYNTDYQFYLGKAFLSWDFSQRSEVSFGGYGSKFKATQIYSDATGTGVSVGLDTKWSPLLSTDATVIYQHTSIDMSFPMILNTSVNTWGATVGAVYKGQLSQYRLSGGRIITPSGGGAVYVNEQAQFQYNRDLTERLAFTGAVIGIKSSQLPSNINENNRSYLQTQVDLKWMIRPTWFLQGGYQYSWQKYESLPDGAANNRIYIRVGYQGLSPQ